MCSGSWHAASNSSLFADPICADVAFFCGLRCDVAGSSVGILAWCAEVLLGRGQVHAAVAPSDGAHLAAPTFDLLSEQPEADGGAKTSYWTETQRQLMETGDAHAPQPRRSAMPPLPQPLRTGVSDTVFHDGLEPPATPIDEDRRQFHIEQCMLGTRRLRRGLPLHHVQRWGIRTRVAVKVLREGIVLLSDRVAMVMEYVEGEDLDVILCAEDPPSLRAVLEILAITSEALHARWNAKDTEGVPMRLVHRDIKPSNIRVGTHGQVKVLDFGIAKFTSEREAKTQANQMIGSMCYMAPERLAHRPPPPEMSTPSAPSSTKRSLGQGCGSRSLPANST